MSFVSNTVDDAQTAITSLGAAIAGAASERVGQFAVNAVGLTGTSIGDTGVRFIVRALVSSIAFGGAASLMPVSSGNIFFSIVFFASNPSLVRDAVTIGNAVVGATTSAARTVPAISSLQKPAGCTCAPGKSCGKC